MSDNLFIPNIEPVTWAIINDVNVAFQSDYFDDLFSTKLPQFLCAITVAAFSISEEPQCSIADSCLSVRISYARYKISSYRANLTIPFVNNFGIIRCLIRFNWRRLLTLSALFFRLKGLNCWNLKKKWSPNYLLIPPLIQVILRRFENG